MVGTPITATCLIETINKGGWGVITGEFLPEHSIEGSREKFSVNKLSLVSDNIFEVQVQGFGSDLLDLILTTTSGEILLVNAWTIEVYHGGSLEARFVNEDAACKAHEAVITKVQTKSEEEPREIDDLNKRKQRFMAELTNQFVGKKISMIESDYCGAMNLTFENGLVMMIVIDGRDPEGNYLLVNDTSLEDFKKENAD